jgi:rhodanese-related sulfurtransferase
VEEEVRGGALLVDVREADDVAPQGKIPGSVLVPRGILEWVADPATPHYDPLFQVEGRVILYCPVGGRSALAADALRALGYRHAAHLAGGLEAWRSAGLPVER